MYQAINLKITVIDSIGGGGLGLEFVLNKGIQINIFCNYSVPVIAIKTGCISSFLLFLMNNWLKRLD